jgi:hypothetical protein
MSLPIDSSASADALPDASTEATRSDSRAHLSNDYLNHYSEVLMLIEMAEMDPEIAGDLANWRPVSYLDYFAASRLRRAADARAGYEALADDRREAFEAIVDAMDRLALTAIAALEPPCDALKAALVAKVTLPAFRGLIDSAASFLNSGGRQLSRDGRVEAAQAVIDRLMDRASAAD